MKIVASWHKYAGHGSCVHACTGDYHTYAHMFYLALHPIPWCPTLNMRKFLTLAIKRPRTRSTAARQVSNAHERDLVTNQKIRLTSKGPKLNVVIRDKISFVGVAHLTRGGRSCSWALYRPCTTRCTLHLSNSPPFRFIRKFSAHLSPHKTVFSRAVSITR